MKQGFWTALTLGAAATIGVSAPALAQMNAPQNQRGMNPGAQLPPSIKGGQAAPQQLEAVKHLDVVNTSLKSAHMNAAALWDMSQDRSTYDHDHAMLFASEIERNLSQADTHLDHLVPLATGSFTDAAQPVTATKDKLAPARTQMRELRSAIASNDVARVHDLAGKIADSTQDAWSSFQDVASKFSYDTSLKTPR